MLGMEQVRARVGAGWIAAIIVGFLLSMLAGHGVAQAQGAVITVNVFTDDEKRNDGICTLREAIISANTDRSGRRRGECTAGNGDDTILLPVGTYVLSRSDSGNEDSSQTGDLDIDRNVTIAPAGPGRVVIDASQISDRVFHILSHNVTIRGVTILGGTVNGDGGGVKVDAGATLTMQNVTLTGNTATGNGGGLFVDGIADVTNVTISQNNAANGTGVGAAGSLTLHNTIVAGDSCTGSMASPGANLFHNASGCPAGAINGDPLLEWSDSLGLFVLQAGSPAIGAAVDTCLETDQLGQSRPHPDGCDLGAYEVPNVAPVANSDGYATDEDVSLSVTALGVLANDSDLDSDPLSATLVSGPTNGTLDFPGDGSFVYTPNANFALSDSFTYVASDGQLTSNEASVSITVYPVNDAPVAGNDGFLTDEDVTLSVPAVGVLDNDSDIDGDALSAVLVNGPSNGSLDFPGDGSFVYAPNANFNGGDSFTYTAYDGAANSNTATVSIMVNPVNDAPSATADGYSTTEDATLTIPAPGVLANDSDPENDGLSAVQISGPFSGTLALNADGSFLYEPYANFFGIDSFDYTANDASAASAPALVTIAVTSDGIIEVNTTSDAVIGGCDWQHCSLREAILLANAQSGVDTIVFEIPNTDPGLTDSAYVIDVQTALPQIEDPVVIDGATQTDGQIVLDGGARPYDGLVLASSAGGSTIRGLTIRNFGVDGIRIGNPEDAPGPGNNTITGNTIAGNLEDGITIFNSTGNAILDNNITGNGALSVDLGGDGHTNNDLLDGDEGANYVQNFPVLISAVPFPDGSGGGTTAVFGQLNSRPGFDFTIQLFGGAQCNSGDQRLLSVSNPVVTTDPVDGDVYFTLTVSELLPYDTVVSATATDVDSNTSEYSDCIVVSIDNDSWPEAHSLDVSGGTATFEQYLDQAGQARWFKFVVQPHSELSVTLTDLPENYDLTIYKDILQVYESLLAPQDEDDLLHLSAEFAPSSFSPSSFSPSSFSPSSFSPSSFSPSSFSPSSFSPSVYSPSSFSPSVFSPSSFSPSSFSPSSFSPSSFSPSSFSPSSFSPSSFSPLSFSPSSFSSAQSRSLIGVSAFDGNASEGIALNTWLNTGEFYVRVRGRHGAFSLDAPFKVTASLVPGGCSNVPAGHVSGTGIGSITPGARAVILVDSSRMDLSTLWSQLDALAARPEVGGVVVDVSNDPQVVAANAVADNNVACPYAKNIVAQEIKDIIDAYRGDAVASPLEYIVLVGGDNVIPFERYPDNALLGSEINYQPPVLDFTASQASLRLGYVLSQDGYGSDIELSMNGTRFPVPSLAVGRLVETQQDILAQLGAYLGTPDGVMPLPASGAFSSLVTGYDFLEDAANAVKSELELGTGAAPDTLITPQEVSPLDLTIAEGGSVWTADDLRDLLLNREYDIAFLAGHFSANNTLAADYRTSMTTLELEASAIDMANMLVYSAGCHSSYNIVNEHGVPGVTVQTDWAEIFARKGATLIAGTGYQYGDTEFLEYSERLYLYFTQQLRQGSGPVPVGKALAAAKQEYLAGTPVLRGIHEKSVLEATLFGLPMFSVNMPGQRTPAPVDVPEATAAVVVDPASVGGQLGLQIRELIVEPGSQIALQERVIELTDVDGGLPVQATWLEGAGGALTNPAEPALPLVKKNVSLPGTVLRGVGLRSASYIDEQGVTPLTGAPTTELRGVHSPFQTDVWFPLRTWSTNYFDALDSDTLGTADVATRLYLTPAQHRSTAPGSLTNTRRKFTNMVFHLFYSNNTEIDNTGGAESVPALADAPTIVEVASEVSGEQVDFDVSVVGNPAAGVDKVWVTYTALNGPFYGQWQSLDLSQNVQNSTRWQAALPLNGSSPLDVRYVVQASNGTGLVTLADNLGNYFIPGGPMQLTQSTLALFELAPPSTGAFGTKAIFSARLTDETVNPSVPLAGRPIVFGLGPQERQAETNPDGVAEVEIPLLAVPSAYPVRAAFRGDAQYAAVSDESETLFDVTKQTTVLTLSPQFLDYVVGQASAITASLVDGAGLPSEEQIPQLEQTVTFVLTGGAGTIQRAVITNFLGNAVLDLSTLDSSLADGVYDVQTSFAGNATHLPSQATGQVTVTTNRPPDCTAAHAEPSTVWPLKKQMTLIRVIVPDPDGDPVSVQYDALNAIYQDEPVGTGRYSPDGQISGGDATVRAERDGSGDGRVYHVYFAASDGRGGQCSGEVRIPTVPHDQGGGVDAIDGGAIYNSITGEPVAGGSAISSPVKTDRLFLPLLDAQ